jgi:hypothetical protein
MEDPGGGGGGRGDGGRGFGSIRDRDETGHRTGLGTIAK